MHFKDDPEIKLSIKEKYQKFSSGGIDESKMPVEATSEKSEGLLIFFLCLIVFVIIIFSLF